MSLKNEAKEAEKVEALNEWAQYATANLWQCTENTRELEIENWETNEKRILRFTKDPKIEVEEAFKKCRRLRRGSEVVAQLIKKSEKRLFHIEKALSLQDLDDKVDALESLKIKMSSAPTQVKKEAPKKPKKGWTGRSFLAPVSKVPILVGRNRRENDKLSIKIAKDGDLWFHARGSAGAHVLLQLSTLPKKKIPNEPSDEDLLFAAEAAAFYSEASNDSKVCVTLALPRHVIKPPRAPPGAVTLRQEHGTIFANPRNHAPRHEEHLRGTASSDLDTSPSS